MRSSAFSFVGHMTPLAQITFAASNTKERWFSMSTGSSLTSLASADARILVPLDGSTRAEGALPVAERLAQELHRPLLLTRIASLVPFPMAATGAPVPAEVYQQMIDDERRAATDYLSQQAQMLQRQGLMVETLVEEGDPAAALLSLGAARPIGLIVMTTHGRTGLARVAVGSVAGRLVRDSHIPVLLAPSPDEQNIRVSVQSLGHILAPLDGSPLAESALTVVRQLAGSVARQITLLRVIAFTADDPERAEARRYLEDQARNLQTQLEGQGCSVSATLVEGVTPGEKIVQFAEENNCLVVMATHGRGGLARLALGSVADQVTHMAHGAHIAALVVHPAG